MDPLIKEIIKLVASVGLFLYGVWNIFLGPMIIGPQPFTSTNNPFISIICLIAGIAIFKYWDTSN